MKTERMANVLHLKLPPDRRILALSDIHANLPYLKGLLKKAAFCSSDLLFIVGDFLEKGQHSLETLRYIMQLHKKGNVYTVCGNCDDWHTVFEADSPTDEQIVRYMNWRGGGLLWDMCAELGIKPEDFPENKELFRQKYASEWAFLAALPHVIETENFIFAHGGIVPGLPLEEHSAERIQRYDSFMTQGLSFDKWVIVGHWPVMLYGTDRVSANPVIDRQSRIISIDGGCVLKDDGQLNALVIPNRDSEDFDCIAYDPFPVKRVVDCQPESEHSYYIRWGDSRVQVLERGEEFSRCRHVRTGYEMDILTKYLFTGEEFTDCNDCTDYRPELKPGDMVSVVEESSRGYFIKHKGISGWYAGRLE
ncbi:MAG: metallophosphoesterase [Oscillospiraceae bacterium]|nr:metallophosphoesterase [Oscillospiraceae bacterium]